MAVMPQRIVVGTSAVRLDTVETVTRWALTIANRGTASIFVGGSSVTTANGFELAVGERLSMTLRPSDGGLYAVAAEAGQRVDRLQVGWS